MPSFDLKRVPTQENKTKTNALFYLFFISNEKQKTNPN